MATIVNDSSTTVANWTSIIYSNTSTTMSSFNYHISSNKEYQQRGTNRQQKARNRNRCKFTLCGLLSQVGNIKCLKEGSLTEKEIEDIDLIEATIKSLINNWDLETVKIGFKPKKKLEEKWSLEF